MNAARLRALVALAAVAGAAAATADDGPIVCTPQPVVCKPQAANRLDPQLQRLLVERQLAKAPPYWTTVYFYLPALDERELQELQIRYLEELLAREKAKRVAADQ